MAHEKSDPQIGLIVTIGIIAIVTVGGLRQGLVSYFNSINDNEQLTKYGLQKPQQLIDLREDETKRLNGGPMPIASSMKMMAADKRQVPGMEPKAADPMREKDTMIGWAQMPHPLPEGMGEDAAAPAPVAVGDAGAPAVGDAAPQATDAAPLATDAAAPKPAVDAAAPHNPNEHH